MGIHNIQGECERPLNAVVCISFALYSKKYLQFKTIWKGTEFGMRVPSSNVKIVLEVYLSDRFI